jgi:antitoxin HigA-1
MKKKFAPIHPGEVLLEDFLKPMHLSQAKLANGLHVPARKINEIVRGKRPITADLALRLAQFFGTSEEVWMNLQTHYDLEVAKDRLQEKLFKDIRPYTFTPVDSVVAC